MLGIKKMGGVETVGGFGLPGTEKVAGSNPVRPAMKSESSLRWLVFHTEIGLRLNPQRVSSARPATVGVAGALSESAPPRT